jgi:hypothetical protein
LICLDADLLATVLAGWLRSRVPSPAAARPRRCRIVIAVDGKTLRGARRADGSQVHLLSALDTRSAAGRCGGGPAGPRLDPAAVRIVLRRQTHCPGCERRRRCCVLGTDSGELVVVKGTLAVSCYLWFDDARQRPAEDALLSTLRTLAGAIVSRR